ncbi:hypothetical protein ABTX35_00620 [Streptomyces sp. NPDC096080]|uniref:hypothetical protein n=1 Tax=Streptomyces sp. NPDC096080 TaxID=3156693 RepID=UPI00332604F7
MLHVTDARTLRRTALPAARRGILTLHIHLAQPALDVTGVRALLVADVLQRTLESHGVQVLPALAAPDLPPDQRALLRRVLPGFGIHPPEAATCAAADAHIGTDPPPTASPGVWIRLERVRLGAPALWATEAGTADGADPLAARLALLARSRTQPVDLSDHALADCTRVLHRWRSRVAEWACSPSRPAPADVTRTAQEALADDLSTPTLLELLHRVEATNTLPDGAKFETFALLDRILALELTRDGGRVWTPKKRAAG